MHICFATDIDKESVTKASTVLHFDFVLAFNHIYRNQFWNHEPVMSEHVLCTIELHKVHNTFAEVMCMLIIMQVGWFDRNIATFQLHLDGK